MEKSGYFEILGKCYFTDEVHRNFDGSQAHCKEIFSLGGRLFEPRNETTNVEVVGKMWAGTTWAKYPWIGITDRSSRGNYKYESDNGHLTVSSRWRAGEPSDENQHCVEFCNSRGDWCDGSCSWRKYCFCEGT